MANRFLGEVTARAGGKIYTLRLDFNTLCALEDATDRKAMEVLEEIETGTARILDMRKFTHAALMHHHPDATELEAGTIMSEVDGVMLNLLLAAYPTQDEVKSLPGNRKAAQKPKTSTT